MAVDTHNKILDLLDQAYHVTDDIDQFDALMESANTYLFEQKQSAVVAKGLPSFADLDPHLESHIERLEGLMSRRTGDEKQGLSMGQHAQLILSNNGQVLMRNSQAQKLLSTPVRASTALAYIEDLPLTHESVAALRAVVREVKAGVETLERILYLQIEDPNNGDTLRSAFGYCRVVPLGNDEVGLHITLSYFDWSPAIFKSLQKALNLSENEGLVLQGLLKGQTHKEIAQARGRSIDTIRSQSKAVLHKAGCAKMNELTHLCTSIAYVIGLSDVSIPQSENGHGWITPRQALHILPRPENRTLAYYEYGDPNGRPILYVHGFFQGPYFLDSMKLGFLNNGLRVIAPSRPYFGYTSPPSKKGKYNQTAEDDMMALIKHLNLDEGLLIVAHHGGSNHAFRLAKTLGRRVQGMVMIGARIPLALEHMEEMNKKARMVSTASRHAPSVMKMIAMLGIKTYRQKGMDVFLQTHYGPNPVDMECLNDPIVSQKFAEGMYHLTQQGADGFAHDGRSQMSDWSTNFEAVKCRQSWIHGRHCHILGAHFVEDYIRTHTSHSVDVVEAAGFNILYQAPELVMQKIIDAANWA